MRSGGHSCKICVYIILGQPKQMITVLQWKIKFYSAIKAGMMKSSSVYRFSNLKYYFDFILQVNDDV